MGHRESQLDDVGPLAREHPWQAGARLVWILLAVVWGGANAGFLAWGPLMADWPLVVLAGLAGAALNGGLWLRHQIAVVRGQRGLARRWWRGLMLAHANIFLAGSVIAGIQLYQVGMLPPLSKDRMVSFDRLVRGMEIAYPYFDLKQADWNALAESYRPQVERAQSERAYYAAIERMLVDLNDGHTGVTPPLARNEGCFFGTTWEIEGQAVVVKVGGSGLDAGLTIGSAILTVDGEPLAEALEAVDRRLVVGSTPRQRRDHAFQYLLHTPFGKARDVTFEMLSGEHRAATLVCPEDPAAAADTDRGGNIWPLLLPVAEREIVSRRLPSGMGYIRIPTFGADLVSEFDAALNEMLDAPGLILDVRGNGGGNSAYADQMAGRLLSEPFAYGRDTYAARLPTRAWRKWMTFRVTPREPIYSGPVVVIMETSTFSSVEQFLVSLVDSGRVQTVGRATGGGSGNPTVFRLPDGRNAKFSTANFVRNDGTPIEGVGLVPDVPVRWTMEDFRQGRDPDLEAAEQLLAGD